MRVPFTFGKIASFNDFANREDETNRLVTNFTSQINTILISPRRWGKSSLVNYAAYKAFKVNKNIRFVFLDLYNVRSEEEFYNLLAKEVLKASFTKTEELVEKARKFLGQLVPQISIGLDPETDFTLSFNWELAKRDPSDILNLSENIAKEKNIKFVICIDEFQNIANFGDSLAIQKKLRSNWQKHKNTAYCLYGSKRHMLIDVFTSVSMPFYKFGDILFLQKIAQPALQKFIVKRFKDTGKIIDKKDAETIVNLVECHPYYAQQLAQLVWLRTSEVCSPEIVKEAHSGLVMQLDFLFQTITEALSNTQVNFLKAVIKNVEEYSSKETIKTYNLGTSANVNRIKTSLENKEIIDISGNKISLLDPLYKYWLAKVYFKI